MKKKIDINDIKPADLPPVLRTLYCCSPASVRMLVVLCATICMMALATRLRVYYCFDMFRHMLACNLLVIGPSGAGKSLVRWVCKMLMAPLKNKDNEERRREQAYSDARNKKSGKKDLPDEPLTVVRYLQSITVPKLVKRADFMQRRYGSPLTFFVYTDELATMCSGSSKNREEYNGVARTAYQEGETYIRETLYQEGYNAEVDVNWCSIMCGQEYALDKYIDKAGILLGDAGRQMIWSLDSLGDDALLMKPFTPEEQQLIDSTTQRLMSETYLEGDKLGPIHEVDMSWLYKDVRNWCHEQVQIIDKSGSKAHESFYKRASLSAYRLCAMTYYLWDEDPKAQPHVRRLYYAYSQWILDGLNKKWGRRYDQMQSDEEEETSRPTLYDQMPQRFTRTQLNEMRERMEITTATRIFVCKWLKRKLITKVEGETDVYEKRL